MPVINIKVTANARKNEVVEEDGRYKVYVSSPAVDGKANKKVIEVLAEHFKVKKNQIEILQGLKSREKVIKIED